MHMAIPDTWDPKEEELNSETKHSLNYFQVWIVIFPNMYYKYVQLRFLMFADTKLF